MRSARLLRPLLGSLLLSASFGSTGCDSGSIANDGASARDASLEDDAAEPQDASDERDASADDERDASADLDASDERDASADLDAGNGENLDASDGSDASADPDAGNGEDLDASDASDAGDAGLDDASEPDGGEEPGETPKLPPFVTALAGSGFTLGGSPVSIVSEVDIVDEDSAQLMQLRLSIVTQAQSGDTLSYAALSGSPVVSTWDADAYTLTLAGAGSLAQYEEAVRAVTFSATQGGGIMRGLSLSATDAEGVENIAPGLVTLSVAAASPPAPPQIQAVGGRSYTIGNAAVAPVSSIDIVDADSGQLKAVTIRVTSFGKEGDVLAYAGLPDNPITATYAPETRTLTLSGVATLDQYENALKAVRFSATQGGWTTRTLAIVATDTTDTQSAAAALTLSVW